MCAIQVQSDCAGTKPAYTDRHEPATVGPCFAGYVTSRAAGLQVGRAWLLLSLKHALHSFVWFAERTWRLLMLASNSTEPEGKCCKKQLAG